MCKALEDLASEANGPVGLVLAAGLEDDSALIEELSARYRLLGSAPRTISRIKNPQEFFGALHELGIPHPETRLDPPAEPRGWLIKRTGGSGGTHVLPAPENGTRRKPGIYFQRMQPGEAVSVLGIVAKASTGFAFSRQWTAPSPTQPYRYGGAVGSITIEPDVEGRMLDAALAVSAAFDLQGLVSFDFLVEGEDALLIEVNPRPGATLDVFDDDKGTLFQAHLVASEPGGDPAALMSAQWTPAPCRAAAYLYADRAPLEVPAVVWPSWTADRPAPGARIARHQPVATAFADAASPEEATELVKSRLAELEKLLYEHHNFEKETH